MDTVKEIVRDKSRVPDPPNPNAAQSSTSSVVVTARLKANENNPFRGQMGARRKPTENDPDVLFLNQQNMIPWRPIRYRRFVPVDAFENRIPLLYPYEDNEFLEQSANGPKQDEYTETLLAALRPTKKSANHNRVEPAQPQTMEELVQSIMLKAHVIRFNKLVVCVRERFSDPHQVTNALVLQHVQKVAVLVRGWWVLKSELLYPPTTYSEHGSIPSTLMIRARDYIMAVFYRGEHLTRKTISSMTKLPALDATEILNLLARKMNSTQKGLANHWEFHPTDHEFIRRFPDVVQQQSAAWEMRIRQLCVQLKLEHLVSDGVRRRRRGSGRLSSESGSEAEYDIPSLVSGVHVSGGTGKRTAPSKRKRQLSLSQAETNRSDEYASSAEKEPSRKRARTQSLSVTASSLASLDTGADRIVNGEPGDKPPLASEFHRPMSPPSRPTSNSVSVPLTPVKKISSPPINSVCSPPANSFERSVSPIPIRIKSEPPSSPTSNGNETFDDHISHPIQKDLKFDAVSSSEPGISDSANEIESDTAGTVNNVPAESSRVALVNLIHDMVRTHPIIGFTEVVKRIQESTLNYCQTIGSELLQSKNVLPGSEAERQLLKEWILEALPDADARQINVPWPSAPTALPEDILITATVGGTECGAVSEMTQKLRGVILELFETSPSVRMGEILDRMKKVSGIDIPKKHVYSMLKQYCVFRHSRYFLRLTMPE
ncbi:DNA-directed RNA polymerase III subunit RPC5 [Fasciolopsis buskii]|uniref:DNA-directed RNA polymerase III subunit RPC5 n=1 Tax=Fasciolopsis buskii TaxID=27845 RepID=A0A8E0S198_9TREM|nr:DNA-directed RNA polymerase III subunit RPC5 [Fasciolopsis buski]